MKKYYSIFLVIGIFIVSCAPKPLIFNEELKIKKGMTMQEINEAHEDEVFQEKYFVKKKEKYSFEFELEGRKFTIYNKFYIDTYERIISFNRNPESQKDPMLRNRPDNMNEFENEDVQVSGATQFYYIFEDDKILWWGTLYDMKISGDQLLLKIAEKIGDNISSKTIRKVIR